jgi:hypothetical protein
VQESEKELASIKNSYETDIMEVSEKVIDLEHEVHSLGLQSSQDMQLATNIRQLEEMTSVLEDLNRHLSLDSLARYETVADNIASSVHSIAIDDQLTVSSRDGLKNSLKISSQVIQNTLSRPMDDMEAVSRNIQILASPRPDLVQEAHNLLHETTKQTIRNTSHICSK